MVSKWTCVSSGALQHTQKSHQKTDGRWEGQTSKEQLFSWVTRVWQTNRNCKANLWKRSATWRKQSAEVVLSTHHWGGRCCFLRHPEEQGEDTEATDVQPWAGKSCENASHKTWKMNHWRMQSFKSLILSNNEGVKMTMSLCYSWGWILANLVQCMGWFFLFTTMWLPSHTRLWTQIWSFKSISQEVWIKSIDGLFCYFGPLWWPPHTPLWIQIWSSLSSSEEVLPVRMRTRTFHTVTSGIAVKVVLLCRRFNRKRAKAKENQMLTKPIFFWGGVSAGSTMWRPNMVPNNPPKEQNTREFHSSLTWNQNSFLCCQLKHSWRLETILGNSKAGQPEDDLVMWL